METFEMEGFMREILRKNFRFFNESHNVNVCPLEKIFINYRTSEKTGREFFDTTHFDFELNEDICYLSSINLEEHLRGKGDGWTLYESVHEFAKGVGMKSIRQYPLGQSMHDMARTRRDYLLDRGYVNVGKFDGEVKLTL